MNTAVAYRYDPEEERSTKYGPAPRMQRRPVSVSARGMLAIVVVTVLVFSVLVALITVKYRIAETQLEINRINNEIHEKTAERTRLEERLERAGSITNLMNRAAALGMAQPTGEQILYITLPGSDDREAMMAGGK